jgi:23S rRNA (uracil1939-C5)-methyltransferase
MNYAAQLAAKSAIIRDCLHRIGRVEYDGDITVVGGEHEFSYRSRARWHVDRVEKAIGYYKRDSHYVVDVATCKVLVPELDGQMQELRSMIADGWNDQYEIDAAAGASGATSVYSDDLPVVANELTYVLDGIEFAFSARSFFQGNQTMIGELVRFACGDLSGETAIDLYCGVGLFTLPLAKKFTKVYGVEEDSEAVRFAKQNKARAGLANVEFKRERVRDALALKGVPQADLILLDPPRSGAEDGVIKAIARLRPKHIVYVSCEPSILARDLRELLDAGYKIDDIRAFDLFPQTHHVETVVRLKREEG